MYFLIIFFLGIFHCVEGATEELEKKDQLPPPVSQAIVTEEHAPPVAEEVKPKTVETEAREKDEEKKDAEATTALEPSVPPAEKKEVSPKQNKGVGLVFQDIPSKKFLINGRVSNILSFTISDDGVEAKSYHLIVTKLQPHFKIPTTGSTEKQNFYVAYVSPLFMNQWKIFAGFSSTTGEMLTFSENDSLHPFLRLALTEMNLQMKGINEDDADGKKVCDISCMYSNDWEEFLHQILSPYKGMHKGENIYACQSKVLNSPFSERQTTVHVFFKTPESIDNCVDIFTTLACFQPFYINKASQRKLTTQLGANWQTVGNIRHFSLNGLEFDPSLEEQTGWLKIDHSEKFREYAELRNLAALLKAQKYEKLKGSQERGKKAVAPKENTETEYFDYYELEAILKLKELMRVPAISLPKGLKSIAYTQLHEIITKVKEKVGRINNDVPQREAALTCLTELLNEDTRKNEEVKADARKLIAELVATTSVKNKFDEIFNNLPEIFGDVLEEIKTTEFDQLFAAQKGFVDSAMKQIKGAKKPTNFEVQMHMILWAKEIFYALHLQFFLLGKNFETYFEKLYSVKEEANNQLSLLRHDDDEVEEGASGALDVLKSHLRNLTLLQEQEQEVMQFYLEYEKVVKCVRRVYMNFGYLPKFYKEQKNADATLAADEEVEEEVEEAVVLAEEEKKATVVEEETPKKKAEPTITPPQKVPNTAIKQAPVTSRFFKRSAGKTAAAVKALAEAGKNPLTQEPNTL